MIQINDNLRITRADKINLQLEEQCNVISKATGEVKKVWKVCGYYGNLKEALRGALKRQLLNLTEEDRVELQAVMERIGKAETEIINAIKEKENE